MINIPIDFIIEVAPTLTYYGSAFALALVAFAWHRSQDLNEQK